MITLLRSRLAYRATAFILGVSFLAGLPVLLLMGTRARRQEAARQQAMLRQLADTVERTAQIACYVGDARLAEEVEAGLLKNAIVGRVAITAGDRMLASRARPDWEEDGQPEVVRELRSPFAPGTVVGRLSLSLDAAELQRQMIRQGRGITQLLALQALIVAGVSVGVVLLLVTRPIARLSRRLHALEAETGESLPTPKGHEHDELGRLVGDVNSLIDRLLAFIHAERFLRADLEEEHARYLVAQAAQAQSQAEVKILQGLLPICAWCKKIRDDEGLWTQVESYLGSHSEATFTHGLCPDCARKQMEEYRRGKDG